MKTNYSQKLAQCIHSFLKSTKAEYTFNANDGTFWFPFQWPNSPFGSLPVQIQIKEEFIQLNMVFPLSIEPSRRAAVKEFISDLNCGALNGCFKLDSHNGQLVYYVFIDCFDRVPSSTVLTCATACACAMMDSLCSGLFRLFMDDDDLSDDDDDFDEDDEDDEDD